MKRRKLREKYGAWAVVAGASEGIGAEFSKQLAMEGFNLILIARNKEKLAVIKSEIKQEVEIKLLQADLSENSTASIIISECKDLDIGIFVYNAVFPLIGHFVDRSIEDHEQLIQVNITSVMKLTYGFSRIMCEKNKGAILLMSSMAGQQGSAMVAHYAASKAYNTVLAEGLWYELKDQNVDIMAVIAGATATPNYVNSKPRKTSMGTPKPLKPEQVVAETLERIGTGPSFITGSSNRIASWFMRKLFSRKKAIEIISKSTSEMYPHYLGQKKDPE